VTHASSFPSLTDRFAAIIRGLRSDVCQRGNQIRLPAWLVTLIYARLTRMIDRFAVLVAKDRANPNPAPHTQTRTRPSKPAPDPTASEPAQPAPPRPPHQFAWLIRLVPPTITQGNAAANGRINIQSLLSDPELQSLIARNPAAGRIFRPLCHMLGIPTPSILRRPRKPTSKPTADHPTQRPERRPPSPPRPSLFPTPPSIPAPWDQNIAFLRLITPRDFQT